MDPGKERPPSRGGAGSCSAGSGSAGSGGAASRDPAGSRGPAGSPGGKASGWLLPLLLLASLLLWNTVGQRTSGAPVISYSEFFKSARAGKVASVEITGQTVDGRYASGTRSESGEPA